MRMGFGCGNFSYGSCGPFEVLFDKKAGYFKETEHDAVMEKVDTEGNIIGFSILKVSAFKQQKTVSIGLKKHAA